MYAEYTPLVYNPITIFPRDTEVDEIKPITYEDLSNYFNLDMWIYWLTTPMIIILGVWLMQVYVTGN